jgi:hypothetical protein
MLLNLLEDYFIFKSIKDKLMVFETNKTNFISESIQLTKLANI